MLIALEFALTDQNLNDQEQKNYQDPYAITNWITNQRQQRKILNKKKPNFTNPKSYSSSLQYWPNNQKNNICNRLPTNQKKE
jgi:hypothetical protein